MELRIQALITGVILTFVSTMACALGLGEIRVNSALNQPLDAEIELLQIRSLTEEDLYVGLATPEAFAQAGVDRASNVLDLKFQADFGAARGPIIKVTSSRPVKEPFLNFLVEARWPSGRMLREYTLLMDLPVFSGERSAPVATSQSSARPSPAAAARSTPPPPSRPASPTRTAQPTTSAAAVDGDTYGPVKASDTLWNIASRVRPDQSVSVQQTMLALQRMNPNAFINNNINLLRRGQVLRVPDLDEINRLGARDAIREVSTQNRNWNSRGTEYEQEPAQLEGSRTYTSSSTDTAQPEGRLKLSARDSFSDTESGRGAGEGEGSESIENALAVTQEQLDATRRENSELRERLRAMEEQVQTMEKLLQVSSEEMRALELSSTQVNDQQPVEQPDAGTDPEEAGTDLEEPTDASPGGTGETAEPAGAELDAGDSDATETSPAVAADEQTEQPAATAEPAEASQQPIAPAKPTIMDLIMDNILYIGIGVGVLLLAIIALIFLRRGRDEYEDDAFEDMEPQFVSPDAHTDDTTVVAYAPQESSGDDSSDQLPAFEDEVTAEAETEDVVAESDIHIAYGQYDQAEEKLIGALETDPGNTAIRLKLLEVLAAQNAAAEFDNQYAKLNETGDTAAIAKAEALRQTIEGIGPYAAPDEMSYESDTLEYDFPESTDDDALSFEEEASTHASADELASEDSFEFELEDSDGRSPAAQDDTVTLTDSDSDFEQRLEISDSTDGEMDQTGEESPAGVAGSGDFEFDLDGSEIDMDLNDLELDVDMGDFDQDAETLVEQSDDEPSSEFTLTDMEEPEQDFTAESLDASDWRGEEVSAEVQDSEDQPWESSSSAADSAENDEFAVPVAYDSVDAEDSVEQEELGGGDSDDLAMEEAELDESGESMSEPETSFDAFYGQSDQEDNLADGDSAGSKDFESDVDLEGDVNLDALDQELDQLSSGWEANANEDESPVDDSAFADLGSDEDPEPAAPVAEVDQEIFTGDPVDESELDLSDTSADKVDTDMDFEIPEFDPEEDDDSNLGFLTDSDETATKLDLARAYIDMGDADGAKDILDEIMEEGDDTQKKEAETLLAKIG